MQPKPNVALPASVELARIGGERKTLLDWRERLESDRGTLELRIGAAVNAGRAADIEQFEDELNKLDRDELRIRYALSALDTEERRVLAAQSRAEVEAHNSAIGEKCDRLLELAASVTAICAQLGPVAEEVVEVLGAIRREVTPFSEAGDLRMFDTLPAAICTEIGLAICNAARVYDPNCTQPYRDHVKLPPTHGAALEFQAHLTARHLIEQARPILMRELPTEASPLEAA